jgi:hypothetical protein
MREWKPDKLSQMGGDPGDTQLSESALHGTVKQKSKENGEI